MASRSSDSADLKLKVDGLAQYKQDLKDARGQLSLVEARVKAATSALDANSTSQNTNAQKAKALQAQLSSQKNVVDQLKQMVEAATKIYGADSTEVANWQKKLYLAQTQANKTTTQINRLTSSESSNTTTVTDTAQQTSNFADAVDRLKDVAGGAKDAVVQAFQSTLDSVKQIVGVISDLMDTAMSSVQGINGITDVYGGSGVDVQRIYARFRTAGMGFGEMNASIGKLIKTSLNGSDDLNNALTAIGVNSMDAYASEWDYYQAVIGGLMALDDKSQVLALASTLFGAGNADEITTLWAKRDIASEQGNRMENAGGFMTQEQIDAVDAYAQKVADIQSWWEQFKTETGAQFVVALGTNIPERVESIIENLTTIFSANTTDEQKREATIQLNGNIELLATDITDALTRVLGMFDGTVQAMMESDNPIVKALGSLLHFITEIGKKVVEKLPTILDLLQKALPYIEANMVTKAVTGSSISELFTGLIGAITNLFVSAKLIKGASTAANVATSAGTGGLVAAGSKALSVGLGTAQALAPFAAVAGYYAGAAYLTSKATRYFDEQQDAMQKEAYGFGIGEGSTAIAGKQLTPEMIQYIMDYMTILQSDDGRLYDGFTKGDSRNAAWERFHYGYDQYFDDDNMYDNPWYMIRDMIEGGILDDWVNAGGISTYDDDGNMMTINLTVDGQVLATVVSPYLADGVTE